MNRACIRRSQKPRTRRCKQRWGGQLIRYTLALFLGLVLSGCVTAPPAVTLAQNNSILVVVDDPRPQRLRQFSYGPRYASPIAYAQDPILKRYSRQIARDYNQNVLLEWPLQSLAVHCFVIPHPGPVTLQKLANDTRVRWVQPFNRHELRNRQRSSEPASTPYELPVSGSAVGVRLTIIDTGADLSHRDLMADTIHYQDLVKSAGVGFAERHGTSILGLIAAKSPDADGLVRGLAAGADIQHLRGCWEVDGQGVCNTLSLALALEAAMGWQPDVLNLSLSGPQDRLLDALIASMAEQGTMVVSAFDETRALTDRFPTPAPNVLFAAAGDKLIAHREHRQTYYAPGHAISLSPMDQYELVSGHSVAAPYLTAMIARLKARSPEQNNAEVIQSLRASLTLND